MTDATQAARLDAPRLTARTLLMDTTEWVTEVFLASGARLGWRRSPSAVYASAPLWERRLGSGYYPQTPFSPVFSLVGGVPFW